MKFFSFLGLVLLSLALMGGNNYKNCIKGEGGTTVRDLDVSGFHGLGLSIPADVFVRPGAKFKVSVEGQSNIIDNIETEVSKGVWRIEFDKCVRGHDDIVIKITMPELSEIALSGSGDIEVQDGFEAVRDLELAISGSGSLKGNFEAQSTELSISGSGDAELGIITQSLDTAISGSGDLEVKGAAEELSVAIAGSGSVDGEELMTNRTDVSIAGSGDCHVGVHESLDVSIVGSGSVIYSGDPKIDRSILGSGSVRKGR